MNIPSALHFPHQLTLDCKFPHEIRRQILVHHYIWCPNFAPSAPRPFLVTNATSGNGDVKLDLAIAWRMQMHYGDSRYWYICRALYGITNLITGGCDIPSQPFRDPVVNPSAQSFLDHIIEQALVDDPRSPPHEDPGHDWLLMGHQDTPPVLALDMDMMAILNARATVILNPIFHDHPHQKMIVMLAMVAVKL